MENHPFSLTRFVGEVHGEKSGLQNCTSRQVSEEHQDGNYVDALRNKLVFVSSTNHDYVGVLADHVASQVEAGVQAAIVLSNVHRLVQRATALPSQGEMAARVLQRDSLGLSEVWIPWCTIEAITALNITPKEWADCEP